MGDGLESSVASPVPGQPIVRDLSPCRPASYAYDAGVQRKAIELAIDVELSQPHRVAHRSSSPPPRARAPRRSRARRRAVHPQDVRHGDAATRGERRSSSRRSRCHASRSARSAGSPRPLRDARAAPLARSACGCPHQAPGCRHRVGAWITVCRCRTRGNRSTASLVTVFPCLATHSRRRLYRGPSRVTNHSCSTGPGRFAGGCSAARTKCQQDDSLHGTPGEGVETGARRASRCARRSAQAYAPLRSAQRARSFRK